MQPSRRRFLELTLGGVVGSCVPLRTSWAAGSFEVKTIEARGEHADRFSLLVPTHLPPGQKLPLLVALHGLGESHDPALGVRAWPELYGLSSSYARLLAPPVTRTSKRGEWRDARLAEVNASLGARPFGGMVVACPFTPNLRTAPDRGKALRSYARWIVEQVVPEARRRAPVADGADAVTIDGCSMGGPLALDVFLAHPESFGAVGVVQSAMGAHRAPGYADRLAQARTASHRGAVHLLTSEGDPFRDATQALARELEKRGVPHALRVLPGPHDQPWLREAGTIEMLLFHERGR